MERANHGGVSAGLLDACLQADGWRALLDRLRRVVGADSAEIWFARPVSNELTYERHVHIPDGAVDEYLEGVHTFDPVLFKAFAGPSGAVSADLLDARTARDARLEPFIDYLERWNIGRSLMVKAKVAEGMFGYVGLQRGVDAPGFGPDDHVRVDVLYPELTQALRVLWRLIEAEMLGFLPAQALGQLSTALFIVGHDRRIRYLNAAAEQLLASRDLQLRPGGLACPTLPETVQLTALIDQAVHTGGGGAMAIVRPDQAPLSVMVTVLPRGVQLFPDGTGAPAAHAAAVWISDPDARAPVVVGDSDPLRAVYGLTHAEARLGRGLLCGETLVKYAEGMGISIGTARWRLKQVQAKVGVRSTADLVRLLGSMPPVVDAGRPS